MSIYEYRWVNSEYTSTHTISLLATSFWHCFHGDPFSSAFSTCFLACFEGHPREDKLHKSETNFIINNHALGFFSLQSELNGVFWLEVAILDDIIRVLVKSLFPEPAVAVKLVCGAAFPLLIYEAYLNIIIWPFIICDNKSFCVIT